MINTNRLSWPFPSYGWLLVKFSLARAECLTLSLSLGVIPCQYRHRWYIAKTRSFSLHFRCGKYWCIFNHFYVIRPKAIEFGEITLQSRLLRCSRSSKVTEFGTNRKVICDFLLVINTNLAPILHRFRDTAFDGSKIAIFGYLSNSLYGGVLLGRSPWNFTWMSADGHRSNWRRNIAENLNSLSRVHERYRRQTTDRLTGDDKFTFAILSFDDFLVQKMR